jgi:hypothetical protein
MLANVSAGNVVAIIAAGVAIAAVVVGWFQTNSTLRQNRELADLEAVRSVLDEAVVGLLGASKQIARIRELKETPDRLASVWDEADLAGERLAAQLERLKVRFGLRHPIVRSFEGAMAACSQVTSAADGMIVRRPMGVDTRSKDEREAAAADLDDWRERGPGIVDRNSERFEDERESFLKAAYALTGAKLKGSEAS